MAIRPAERGLVTGEDFEAVWPVTSSTKGWLAKEEAEALYQGAAEVPPGQWIVEIGSHHGRSTTALAGGKRAGVHLLAIDPYGGRSKDEPPHLRAFCASMDRVGADGDVQLFWGTSQEAARYRRAVFAAAARRPDVVDIRDPDNPRVIRLPDEHNPEQVAAIYEQEPEIGLLFIDGLHDRHSVLLDIELWEPLVAEGGLVCFHDAYFRRGVTLALFQRHLLNRQFRYERSVVNMAIFRRASRLRTRDAAGNVLGMTARLTHLARNLATTVGLRQNWNWLLRIAPPLPDFEYRVSRRR